MNEVSRRNVLKGAAALAAAASIGRWLPLTGRVLEVSQPASELPPVGTRAIQVWGKVVRITPAALDENDMIRDIAYESIDRALDEALKTPRVTGWRPLEPRGDRQYFEFEPGSDHHDPLAQATTVGAREAWLAEYLG